MKTGIIQCFICKEKEYYEDKNGVWHICPKCRDSLRTIAPISIPAIVMGVPKAGMSVPKAGMTIR